MVRPILCLIVLLLAADAHAAGTRRLREEASQFLEGEFEGLILDEGGRLRAAAVAATGFTTDAFFVWCLARDDQGRILAGTGDGGTIYRQDGDSLQPWVKTLSLEVLSLLPRRDGLLAGTSPDGVVYRIDDSGGVTVALDVPQQSVWALAEGTRSGSWLAAAGPGARILRVSPQTPAGEVLHDLPATNAIAMLRDAAGLWVATEGPSLLLRIAGEDDATPRVVYEADAREIRELVPDGDGGVILLEVSLDAAADTSETKEVSRLTWHPASGGVEVLFSGSERLISLVALADRTLLAGESGTGRILRIDRSGRRSLWIDLEEGDALALRADGDGVLVGTGNLGRVYQLAPARRGRGTFTSQVLALAHNERFGRLRGEGAVEGARFQTRTGVRRDPDTTWSEWSDERELGEGIASPVAPYLQYRILAGGDDAVSAVEIAWRERNLAPRVMLVKVEPAGGELEPGRLSGSPNPVSQRFEDGLGVEYSIYQERRSTDADRAAWARGLRTIAWRAEDPNGDALRYNVEVRRAGDGPWHQLVENHPERVLAWDTRAWDDGAYVVRVTATDTPGNPADSARSGALEGSPVHVDNTPPRLLDVEWPDGSRVRFGGEDASSPLVEASIRSGAGEWGSVSPQDGVLDHTRESFEVDVDAGPVWIRLVDAAGNVRVEEVRRR